MFVGWDRFRVKLKPTENHWKSARSHRISPNPTKIQWDLAEFGRDFFKFDDFSPKSCWESLDLLYLCRIWLFWLTKFVKSSWNLVGKLENSPECSCSSGRSSFTGFEGGDSKPTHRRRVLELGISVWPPEQLDRVEAGRVRAVWVGWAGGWVGWTALLVTFKLATSNAMSPRSWRLWLTLKRFTSKALCWTLVCLVIGARFLARSTFLRGQTHFRPWNRLFREVGCTWFRILIRLLLCRRRRWWRRRRRVLRNSKAWMKFSSLWTRMWARKVGFGTAPECDQIEAL